MQSIDKRNNIKLRQEDNKKEWRINKELFISLNVHIMYDKYNVHIAHITYLQYTSSHCIISFPQKNLINLIWKSFLWVH